jgi:hypothetical protein
MNCRRSCRRSFAASALLSLALTPAATAQDDMLPRPEQYGIRLEGRFFQPSLTGVVQKGTADEAGSVVDLEDDLGITDKRTYEGRGTIQFRRGHKLRVSYTHLRYDVQVAEARRNFSFGETDFERFSRLRTTMKGAFYAAEYEWDFMKGPRGYLGVLLGAKLVDVDYVIASPPSLRETDTLRSPVPTVGAAARLYAGRLSLEGELSGLTIGSRGTVVEAQTSARLHLSDRLAVQGGYRLLKLKAEEGLDMGDVRFSGFTFGLELSL